MYEKTRAAGFGREVKRRIMIGTYVLSAGYYDAYYVRAQKIRTLIKRDFEEVYAQGVDAILTPATPSAAFGIGEKGSADPVEMYLNDIFTVTVNMAGLPGIAVPAGLDAQGLPLGLQLIGRAFDEETLFAAGQVIEEAAGRMDAAGALVGRGVTPSRSSRLRSGFSAAFDPFLIADRASFSAGRPTSSARSSSRPSRRFGLSVLLPGSSTASACPGSRPSVAAMPTLYPVRAVAALLWAARRLRRAARVLAARVKISEMAATAEAGSTSTTALGRSS